MARILTYANGQKQLIDQTYIDLPEHTLAIPNPPADTARLAAIDVEGLTALVYQSPTGFQSRVLRDNLFIVRNGSGVALSKGAVVRISGITGAGVGAAIVIDRALAAAGATYTPAFGILAQDIAANAYGRCMILGRIDGINTSAFAALDLLYVSPTVAGGLTNIRPIAPNYAQPIAQVIVSHASNGAITVMVEETTNDSYSTVRNIFSIGDGLDTTKTLRFLADFQTDLTANASANRSIALPDASGTMFLFEQAASLSTGTAGGAPAVNKVVRTDSTGYLHFTLFYNVLDLGANGSIGRKHTRSANVPTSPQIGDTWEELDGSNRLLYGWAWWWDGTYWRSPEQATDYSFENLSTAAGGTRYSEVSARFNLYIVRLELTSFVANTNSGSSYWKLDLIRINALNLNTSIATLNTSAQMLNMWNQQSVAVNTHININNVNAKAIAPTWSVVGSPGLLYAGVRVIFQYARL